MKLEEREAWKHETIRASNAEMRVRELEAEREEKDREIERLRGDAQWLERMVEIDAVAYQHRRRKWALKECKTWQRYFCFYKDDAVRFHSDRADKAEARVKAQDIVIAEYKADDYDRIKELEQELSWTIDAEQKAEKDVEERDGRIKELKEGLREAKEEIEYCHADMLSPEERAHPRGSGWARVYDKIGQLLK